MANYIDKQNNKITSEFTDVFSEYQYLYNPNIAIDF